MKKIFTLTLISIYFIINAQVNFKEAYSLYEDENYYIALKQFKRLYKRNKDDVKINYYMAMCYLKTDGIKKNALQHLIKVKKSGSDEIPADIEYQLAKAYFYNQEFDKAKAIFKSYKENNRATITTEQIRDINHWVEYCDNAKELMKTPKNVEFINLGTNINSRWSEIDPYITPDGQQLVYTSNKKYISDFMELVSNAYWTYPEYQNGSEWHKMKSFGKRVNSESNEVVVGMSHSGEKVFINVRDYLLSDDIYITSKERKRFTELEGLTKTVNSKFIENGACFSTNEDTLYFSSNRPGGYGGLDIYISVKLPDGTWGLPMNLGPEINTKYDDDYPNLSYDGKKLYFASKGHNSMGGFDVFVSERKAGKWTKPKNLGYPINDLNDNRVIAFTEYPRYAYIAKSYENGEGYSDIYKMIYKDVPPPAIVYTGNIKVGRSYKPEELSKYNEDITITVTNDKTGEELEGFQYNKTSKKYVLALKPGKYTIKITGDKYKDLVKKIEVHDVQPVNIVNQMDLYMQLTQ